jgi:hypothetical protein
MPAGKRMNSYEKLWAEGEDLSKGKSWPRHTSNRQITDNGAASRDLSYWFV